MDVENIRCILSRRRLSAACVVLAPWPTSLPAQTVWGIVIDDGTGVPLEGAMMILFDRALQEVDRSLSDATGRYTLKADSAGAHVIRVDRIGYASLSTGTLDVPEQGLFRRIEVPLRPIQLEGLAVQGGQRCEVRAEEGAHTARVWAEARKALEAAA